MKKNKMMRLAAIVMMLTLLTTCAISGTFAKYVTEASASDTARVAKWDIDYNGGTLNNDISFALFDTAKVYDAGTTTVDDDVKTESDPTKAAIIAPGTCGSFTFKIENKSEVTATYAIDYTVTNNGIPIEYSIDGTNWTTDLADVSTTNLTMETGSVEITVQWRWAFEGSSSANYTSSQTDTTDTNLGTATPTAEVQVSAKITVTQVD